MFAGGVCPSKQDFPKRGPNPVPHPTAVVEPLRAGWEGSGAARNPAYSVGLRTSGPRQGLSQRFSAWAEKANDKTIRTENCNDLFQVDGGPKARNWLAWSKLVGCDPPPED